MFPPLSIGLGWLIVIAEGAYLQEKFVKIGLMPDGGGTFWLPRHLENWMPYAMYMSHVTGLFWAPNHVLPGLWFGGLALLRARGEIGTAHLVVAVAALALWSPLAMIGAAAVLVYFIASEYRALAAARSWWCACLVAAGFIPVALYLTADAGAVGHGWQFGKKDFAQNLVMFLTFEVDQPSQFS